jgi:hypothetical protein
MSILEYNYYGAPVNFKHIITSSAESLKEYIPDTDHGANSIKVQTHNGIGVLHIIRDHDTSYHLSYYKPNESRAFWGSSTITDSEAVDVIWLQCWARPGGFLP